MHEQQDIYDLTIIGGGPAGLYAAFYSGMRDMKTKLIEAQPELGGKMLSYPEKLIWDVGGVTPIRSEQFVEHLKKQALTFEPAIILGEQAASLSRLDNGIFELTTTTGSRHYTKALLLAVGYGIRKPTTLQLEGADRFEVSNLYYTVQELATFTGKHIVISGGGDAAVDWANALVPLAASVTVVHRREQFGGHEHNIKQMRQSAATLYTPYRVRKLISTNGSQIEQVIITHTETGEERIIDTDAVIVSHGMKSDFGPLLEWGLDIDERTVSVNASMETNLPGIFAAGDFVHHDKKLELIAGAFADAALAVNGAKRYLDPQAPKTAYVSSHNIRFKERNRQYGLHDEDYRAAKS